MIKEEITCLYIYTHRHIYTHRQTHTHTHTAYMMGQQIRVLAAKPDSLGSNAGLRMMPGEDRLLNMVPTHVLWHGYAHAYTLSEYMQF